jgi:Na+-driven multidrug efflux pump
MTLVGQNLGANRPEQATRAGWMALALGAAVMSLMGVIFYTLARPMFQMFCPGAEQEPIIDAGVDVLRLIAFAMPPLASAIILTSALRGAGDTRVPVVFTWIGFFAVRIPLAYWLALDEYSIDIRLYPIDWSMGPFRGCNLGLYGCWLAMTTDICVRGVFFFWRFVHGAWQKQRV